MLDRIAADRHVPGSGPLWLYPFLVAAISAPAAVGALIATRRPRNLIGWILVLGALSLAAVLAAETYASVALDAYPGSLPGGSWAALVASQWPFFFAWPLAVAFVFPDGRLPSRRWRPYTLFAVASMALLVLLLVLSAQLEKPFSDVPNPFPLRLPAALGFLRLPIWLAVFESRRREGVRHGHRRQYVERPSADDRLPRRVRRRPVESPLLRPNAGRPGPINGDDGGRAQPRWATLLRDGPFRVMRRRGRRHVVHELRL